MVESHADLRGASTVGGDIIGKSDTSIVFRATIGKAATFVLAASSVVIPSIMLANRNTLASFASTPRGRDTVFVYDDGLSDAATDDRSRTYGTTAAPTSSTVTTVACTATRSWVARCASASR